MRKHVAYDALQYASQVEKAAKSHREEGKKERVGEPVKKPNAGEYLTGFYREDKLIPVITLVVYFGADEWDGPKSLHDMMAVKNAKILSFVPDYEINLISPAEMSDEEIDRFTTNLREVMLFIKYSKDKKKLGDLVTNDERFKTVEQKAARVINIVTGSELDFNESEGSIDMCKAIEDMRKDAGLEAVKLERIDFAKRMNFRE